MRIALIGPPFLPVPPVRYGGTELFMALLARELHARGHHVTVYANGESKLPCEVRWRYAEPDWPPDGSARQALKNADHTAWATRDAMDHADLLHFNDAIGLPMTLFVRQPSLLTLHHPHEPYLSELYARFPGIDYVAVGAWLKDREPMPRIHVVHHGIPLSEYRCSNERDDYVAFLGRIAPCKGTHLAIEAARRAGVRLKIAGEVQPQFQSYYDQQVRPHLGEGVELVGEVDHEQKNALLSKARALLFPIQWEEPFGLVMIEAMACGAPVLAFAGGAVKEIVSDGVSGFVCADLDEMVARIRAPAISAESCRAHAARHFSSARMADDYIALYERVLERRPTWKT